MASRLREYWLLTRMHRPIGTLLLLWPTLWALWIASDGQPRISDLLIFSLGTLLMRSAGCAINDYADRDFDRHVKRTADRPLTAGRIKPWEALAVFAFLSLVALSLIISYNKLTWLMAAIAAFLAVSYPFTKRFLSIPQAYLGIAFGFGIPMAFAATTNAAPPLCWVLLLANIFWAIAYDTEYAMVDRDDDIHLGIKTSAITFGRFDVEMVMLSYGITLALLVLCGQDGFFGFRMVVRADRSRVDCNLPLWTHQASLSRRVFQGFQPQQLVWSCGFLWPPARYFFVAMDDVSVMF